MAGHGKLASTTKENRAAEESRAAEKSRNTEEEDWADPKLQLDQKQSREEYCQQPEHWAGTPKTWQAGIADCNQEKDISDQSVGQNL